MKGTSLIIGSMLIIYCAASGTAATPRLVPGEPTLAPLGYTVFCIHYPKDCNRTAGNKKTSSSEPVTLSPQRHAELATINAKVNQSIAPLAPSKISANAVWVIKPKIGDCSDYAVTKRHKLLVKGWPSHALLLAEVALVSSGEHHLVLIVRTNVGDLVLDNLTSRVRAVTEDATIYKWVRMETDRNPDDWANVHSVG